METGSMGYDPGAAGYDHVTICCTCENQKMAEARLPIFLEFPIKHRTVIHEPMLEAVDIRKYLAAGGIEQVTCGGESGPETRVCDFAWILNTMQQCVEYDVPFWFNLIENAVKYNRRGGRVTVTLSGMGDRSQIWIADTGIGLAVAKAIVEQYYSEIILRSTEGVGTTVIVIF